MELSDAELEALLYKNAGKKQGHRRIPEPDWAVIHRELKRKHVTLTILWEEYIAVYPDGYRYSRFCELYRAFADRLPVTMRQSHAGGEKLFVDYAGIVTLSRPALASPGLLARWATRPAVITAPPFISASQNCSPSWRWPEATGVTPGF